MLHFYYCKRDDTFSFREEVPEDTYFFRKELYIKPSEDAKLADIFSQNITICTDIYTDELQEDFKKANTDLNTFIAILKSNIQKCTRRRDTRIVQSVSELWRVSPIELFRRLPIIMIEDTYPSSYAITRLVWLMCAYYHGYKPTKEDFWFCMNVSVDMIEREKYLIPDYSYVFQIDEKRKSDLFQMIPYGIDSFTPCMALQIRKSYGTMKSDSGLITYNQKYWLTNTSKTFVRKISCQPFRFSPFSKSDILMCSLDIHAVSFLKRKIPKFYCIWLAEGRLNSRRGFQNKKQKETPPEALKDFESIKRDLENLRKWILETLI